MATRDFPLLRSPSPRRSSARGATTSSLARITCAALALAGASVQGATFRVTTTLDVIDGQDPFLSLREAVGEAAALGGSHVIELSAGTHVLTCSADPALRVGNRAQSANLTVRGPAGGGASGGGAGAIIRQTCPGARLWILMGDGASLALRDIVLRGTGTSTLDTAGLAIGARDERNVAEFTGYTAVIVLDNVDVSGFDAGASGSVIDVGQRGADGAPPALGIRDSRLHANRGTVVGGTGASVKVERSEIVDNDGSGIALTDGYPLVVENATVSRNTGTGIGTTGGGFVAGNLELRNSTVAGNGFVGVACSQCSRARIENSTIRGNGLGAATIDTARGGVWMSFVDGTRPDEARRLDLVDVQVVENRSGEAAPFPLAGGVPATLDITPDTDPDAWPVVRISGGLISRNVSGSRGGGLLVDRGSLEIDDTRLDDN